jgi:Restriction endonuclease NaeI
LAEDIDYRLGLHVVEELRAVGLRPAAEAARRTEFRPEGILVLGHQDNDLLVAKDLGLQKPRKSELIAVRVVPAYPDRDDPVAVINGERWAVARSGDPVVEAPVVDR